MPAKDIYHDSVVKSLKSEEWIITHDPLTLSYGDKDLFVDLGAEKEIIAAEKDKEKIAVEIKSFLSPSPIRDLEEAVGQYNIYRILLTETEPDRILWLAVPQRVYEGILTGKFGQLIVNKAQIRVLVFNSEQEKIIRWI